MSEKQTPSAPPPKKDPESLVLRGAPRPAVRFRRGLIVSLAGAFATGLAGLSWFALEPTVGRKAATAVDPDEPAPARPPDPIAAAPGSYADVPRLGPPLPGDLGVPILEHERSAGDATGEADDRAAEAERVRSAEDRERERDEAAMEAARSSPVLVQLAKGPVSGETSATTTSAKAAGTDDAEAAPGSTAVAPTSGQEQKIAFARGSGSGDVNPYAPAVAPSPWTVSAGTVIAASLITGLNSDLPGTVIAQVTENVRDSATGTTVLIPQGARLLGTYDSAITYGQRRALLVWNRIVFPDGSSVRLDAVPATDSSGYAGLADRVDLHTWGLLKGAALSTLLGVGTQLSFGGESGIVRAIRESTQQSAADAGNRMTSRNLDVQPTITVRPGWPVRAIVNKDLVLQPWRG